MAGEFDDLIPSSQNNTAAPAPVGNGMFDDLIPQEKSEVSPSDNTPGWQKLISRAGRDIVTGVAGIADIPAIPFDIEQRLLGQKPALSIAEQAGKLYDSGLGVGGTGIAKTRAGRDVDAALSAMAGGGAIKKLASLESLPMGAKVTPALEAMAPKTATQLASFGTAGAAANEAHEEYPNSTVLPILAGVAGSLVPAAATQGIKTAAGLAKNVAGGEPVDNVLASRLAGQDLPAVRDALANSGDQAVLADVAGDSAKGLMRAVSRVPGVPKDAIGDFFTGRTEDAPARVSDILSKISGEDDYFGSLDTRKAARQEQASPLYRSAYDANPSMSSPEIDRILSTPAGLQALRSTATTLQNSGKRLGIPAQELAEQSKLARTYEPGDGGIASGLNLRTLDLVKQNLGRQYTLAASGQHPTPGLPSSILDVKNDLLSELDRLDNTAKAGPKSMKPEGGDYAQARHIYSSSGAVDDAQQVGLTFDKMTPKQIQRYVQSASPSEMDGFQTGMRQNMQNTAGGVGGAPRLINSPNKIAQIKAAFTNDPDGYTAFMRGLQQEKAMKATQNSVMSGSNSDKNLAENGQQVGDMAADVFKGGTLGFLKGRALDYGARVLNTARGITPKNAALLANIMTSKSAGVDALDRLIAMNANSLAQQGIIRSFAMTALRGGVTSAQKTVQPQAEAQAPSQDHIDLLKNNPALAPHFDSVYGQGAANSVLSPPDNNAPNTPAVPPSAGVSPQSSVPQSLIQNEGEWHMAYNDTTGNRTVGIGFNMDSGIAKQVWKQAGIQSNFRDVYNGKAAITPQDSHNLLQVSYHVAQSDARKLVPRFDKLSQNRQSALSELSYQMGYDRLSGFKNFKSAMNNGDFTLAARELVRSDWYDQTQDSRKRQIIEQLVKG